MVLLPQLQRSKLLEILVSSGWFCGEINHGEQTGLYAPKKNTETQKLPFDGQEIHLPKSSCLVSSHWFLGE